MQDCPSEWLSGKESACQCRIPDLGRSHMPWSSKARAPQLLKPMHLEPMLCNKGSHCNEKPMSHSWRVGPAHCNKRKKARTAMKTQHSQKLINQ